MSDNRSAPNPSFRTAIKSEEEEREREKTRRQPQAERQAAATSLTDSATQSAGSKRPFPWPETALSQPRPESLHSRSIGVHSILNPTEGGELETKSRQNSIEVPLNLPSSPKKQSSTSPLAPISTVNAQYIKQDRPSVSPHNPPRRIITPISPSVRYATTSGKPVAVPGKVSVSESPFVQELSTGVYNTPANIPVSTEARLSPNLTLPGINPSRHSTPTLHHNRHPSGGPTTNPSSQASSPSTPHSTYSSFAQSSPSMTPGLLQPPGQSQLDSQTPLIAMDSLSRTPSRMGSSRYGDDQVSLPGPPEMLSQNGPMIPVTIDLKSGSRSQAEKRKANSDASRRFRNRKKNEAVLEQRISQLMEQLQSVTEQRDFYRSERDFFRDNLGRHVGSGQIPPRPASPRNYRAGLGQTGDNTIKMERMSKSAGASPSLVPLQTQPPSLPMPLPQSAQNSPYASPTVSQHRSYSGAWPSGPGASGESGASAHGQYRPADIGYVNTWSRP